MPLPLPTASDGYIVVAGHRISIELWNAVLPSVHARVAALEAVKSDLEDAVAAVTTDALALVANSVAPNLADIQAELDAMETLLALAEDRLAAISSGGVVADNVTVQPISGLDATNAQDALEIIIPAIKANTTGVSNLASGKMDKAVRGAADGVAPLNDTQKVPDANVEGDTLRVGDIISSARASAPAKFLRADGAKYLKSSYPDLATEVIAPRIFDRIFDNIPIAGTNATVNTGVVGGDYYCVASGTEIFILNLKTGVHQILAGGTPLTTSYVPCGVYYNSDDGCFYLTWHTISAPVVKSIDPVSGTISTVTNNLPAASNTRIGDLNWINGYWYASTGAGLYRGLTLNSLAVVSGFTFSSTDAPVVDAAGTLWVLYSTSLSKLYKSTDNGATWAEHGPAGKTGAVYNTVTGMSIAARLIFVWQGVVYYRLKFSSGNAGFLFRIKSDGASELVLSQDFVGREGTVLQIADDYFAISGPDANTPIVLDARHNIVSRADLLQALGSPSPYSSIIGNLTNGVTKYHPLYGLAWCNRLVAYWRLANGHDYDTEVRVPKMPIVSGYSSYIKALP